MKLYLVQHGEATSKANEPERPLTEKGHDDINTWEADTLVVGHLPYLEKLISFLTIKKESTLSIGFQPGTEVCLQCSGLDNKDTL